MISIKNNPALFKQILLAFIVILLAILISAIFILIPALMFNVITKASPNLVLLAIFKQFSIFALLFSLPLFLKKSRIKIIAISIFSSLYFCFIYFIIGCHYLTRNIFNPYYLIDSYDAIIPTGAIIFGKFTIIMLIAVLIALFLIICYFFISIYNLQYEYAGKNQANLLKLKYLLVIPLFIVPIVPPHQGYLSYNYNVLREAQKARNFFKPDIPDYAPDLKNAADNIFILQLESINALVLQGQAEMNNKKYPDLYIPNLWQIAKDGVFFPYFWSNSMQTDRAQENIFCGLANNIGPRFFLDAGADLKSCLPHKLKETDYRTIAFRSDTLKFNNMGEFMEKMGFDEVHYDDIMQPQDVKYKWGYDDCTFYQRAFEYLKKKYPNPRKLMVFFEVSSAHIPWENKSYYSFADKIPDPSNYTERYINAESEQDYCLSKFYEEYQNFNPPQTHLFILSDTSSPIGVNDNDIFSFQNNFNENFLTTFLYIPPVENKAKYQTGKTVPDLFYSHSDILPTIYEILSGQNYQNSFAYELISDNTKNNHENCQILSQPYSGSYIIVINNDNKYLYSIIDKTVTLSNIKTDIWEKNSTIIENNVTFQDFKDKYFCERYK
jgi:hypothetical protein